MMFTRIVYGTGEERVIPHDGPVKLQQDENDPNVVLVHISGDCYGVDKREDELYLMNDQGQTIDSYRWDS